MSNFLFNEGKNLMMTTGLNLTSAAIKVALVKDTPIINPSVTTSNISSFTANLVGTPHTLVSRTVTGNIFDAGDASFTSVASGSNIKGFVIYDSGPGTLIAWIDQGNGIPFATNGGNITLTFSDGPNKIFAL